MTYPGVTRDEHCILYESLSDNLNVIKTCIGSMREDILSKLWPDAEQERNRSKAYPTSVSDYAIKPSRLILQNGSASARQQGEKPVRDMQVGRTVRPIGILKQMI